MFKSRNEFHRYLQLRIRICLSSYLILQLPDLLNLPLLQRLRRFLRLLAVVLHGLLEALANPLEHRVSPSIGVGRPGSLLAGSAVLRGRYRIVVSALFAFVGSCGADGDGSGFEHGIFRILAVFTDLPIEPPLPLVIRSDPLELRLLFDINL